MVPFLEVLHGRASLFNSAGELVAHDEVFGTWLMSLQAPLGKLLHNTNAAIFSLSFWASYTEDMEFTVKERQLGSSEILNIGSCVTHLPHRAE